MCMRRRTAAALAALLCLTAISAPAAAADPTAAAPARSVLDEIRQRDRIVAGSSFRYRQLNFRNPRTGRHEGFMVDIAGLLAKKLLGDVSKVEWRFIEENDLRAVNERAVDVVIDISDVGQFSERVDLAEYTGELLRSGPALLVRKGSPVKTINDVLPDSRVIFMPSSPGARYLRALRARAPGATYIEGRDQTEVLAALQAGRADMYTDIIPRLYDFASRHPDYTLVGRYSEKPYYFVVRKGEDEMSKLLAQFIVEIKKNGEYDELYSKWFDPHGGRMVQ